jgi:hypothetical protein
MSHRRRQRDVCHHVLIISQRVFPQRSQIVRIPERVADFVSSDDPQLIQRERRALAHLVSSGNRV